MKCPTCGTDNLEGTRYCGDCGAKLSRKPDSSRASMPLPEASATPTNAEAIQPVEEAKLILTATGNEYPINKDIVLLGRESIPDSIFPDIDLTLVDPEGYVSREHAKIQRQDKQYTIIDLDSTNGTFVNNDRLEEDTPHPLTSSSSNSPNNLTTKPNS